MIKYNGIKFANHKACYIYKKLQQGRAAAEKKACKWLDTIDVLSYIDKGWIDIYVLMEKIADDYPEQEDTLNTLTVEEFIEYLQCRYSENINTQEEVITNYYIQKRSC